MGLEPESVRTKKRKNKSNVQRRKRLKGTDRLASAKNWVATYEGKNAVRGYSEYFGVNLLRVQNWRSWVLKQTPSM